MEKNDVNYIRLIKQLKHMVKTFEGEAHCFGYRDDPDYLAIKEYLEKQIERLQGGQNMEQWEYKHAYIALLPPPPEQGDSDLGKLLQEELCRFGAGGWELVSISPGLLDTTHLDGYAIFKRKLND